MTIELINQDIRKCETTIQNRMDEFSRIRKSIITAIKVYVKEEMQKLVDHKVINSPDHTKSLGYDSLRDMKIKLKEIIDNADSVIDATYADDAIWMHTNYISIFEHDVPTDIYTNKKRAEEKIRNSVGRILGRVGELLNEYKYITVIPAYNTRVYGEWKENSQNEIIYAYRISAKHLDEVIKEYSTNLQNLHDDIEKLRGLQRKLAEQEASDLWKQI